MKDLWERFKRFCNGQDRIERRSRGFELHMELPVFDTERARKQARAELRDRFAMAALTGLVSDPACGDVPACAVSDTAYEYADAMLKARGDE